MIDGSPWEGFKGRLRGERVREKESEGKTKHASRGSM